MPPPPTDAPAPPRTPAAAELREKVRSSAEDRPGVYRFVGPRGEALYVGKSVRVRTRLLSHFREGVPARTAELLRAARDVEWEHVPNEFEALLRELRLIRAFRPPFNVRHRRERPFAWVRLTRGPAPRLAATRRPRPDGSRYFGPFPAGRSLPGTLRDLAHAAGLRDCSDTTPIRFADQLDLLGPAMEPLCPRADLGSCPGPCAARCSEEAYGRNVRAVAAFLEGRDDGPLERLRDRMEGAARRRDFEHAAGFRDRIAGLEALRDRITTFRDFLQRLTFLYLPVPHPSHPAAEGSRGYLVVEGRVRFTFPTEREGSPDEPEAVGRAVRTLVVEPPTPPEALTPSEREELFLVARWFRDRPGERKRTLDPGSYLRRLPGT